MKTKSYIWAALSAAAIISLSACQDNDSPEDNTPHEVMLNFHVEAATGTRAAATQAAATGFATRGSTTGNLSSFADGAQVGVYFAPKNANALDANSGVSGNSANHLYDVDGTTATPVYWNDYPTALDLYAYSPYDATAPLNTGATGISWSIQADQSGNIAGTGTDAFVASDLLISNNVRGLTYTANKQTTQLNFTHALAKLRVNIVDNSTDGTSTYTTQELAAATVSILGLNTQCDVAFVSPTTAGTKTISSPASPQAITPKKLTTPADIATKPEESPLTAAATHEAICIPQTVAASTDIVTVSVTSGGVKQSYTMKTDDSYQLVQSATNVLNVSIGKTDVGLSFSVTEWDESGTSASKAITIDGITDAGTPGITVNGGDTYKPAAGDKLKLTYITSNDGVDALSTDAVHAATYTYNGSTAWTTDAPLYWDAIAQSSYSGKFAALFTYNNAGTTPETDFLTGLATASNGYGTALSLTLGHAMSQIAVTLVPGEGYKTADAMLAALTTRIIRLKKVTSTAPAVDTEGKAVITLANAVSDLIGGANTTADAADAPFGNGTVYTVAPQTLGDDAVIVLKLDNGNSYTLKLADIKTGTDPTSDNLFGTPAKIEPGKKYAITITVDDTAVSLSGSINDWTEIAGSGSMKPDWEK
ncbi:fimbrillin family protein [Bacteroides sp. GD17]|jgi:hypothetical protein|uniref:fimbrillin family protein n=1 Tax=Bacteroides sp. GD17 TaxID=3139826 RepID=UPI00313C78A5